MIYSILKKSRFLMIYEINKTRSYYILQISGIQ